MEVEQLRQHPGGLLVTGRDVHPDQPVTTVEQGLQFLDGVLRDALVGDRVNVHPLSPSLAA
jgi:hypothetical protein